MTDADGAARPWTPRSSPRWARGTRRALPPLFAIAALLASGVVTATPPAGADQLGNLKVEAAQLQNQITTTETHIDALSQQYDEAQVQLHQLNDQIATTKAHIAADQDKVTTNRNKLRDAAINEFMTDGTAATGNPLFDGDQQTASQEAEYRKVAEGDLGTALALLHNAEVKLHNEQERLQGQQDKVQQASDAAAQARSAAQDQENQLQTEESRDQGQIHQIIAQQEAAAAAAQEAKEKAAAANLAAQKKADQADAGTTDNGPTTSTSPTHGSVAFVPPSNGSAGATAVAAAESQLGVPYIYAAESPGVGFDCSGLTAWAWGQAGVPLSHYSGAQMSESTPVPLSDLEPGDLLFYGPGGSQHVAMYVGGGTMIEAPHTGAVVWLTSLRTSGDFVGAGRP